jgi:predicted metallopeptidase
MRLRYSLAPDVKGLFDHIARSLQFDYIHLERVFCFRSFGSKSQGVIARVHALPKIWQYALDESSYYAIEVVSERFDPLPNDEKERVLIHEALHIPRAFGGGFRPHKGWISEKRVDVLHRKLLDGRDATQSNGYLAR